MVPAAAKLTDSINLVKWSAERQFKKKIYINRRPCGPVIIISSAISISDGNYVLVCIDGQSLKEIRMTPLRLYGKFKKNPCFVIISV